MLTVALLVACAFAAGVTGAWSPCGFSMVETLAGAAGREGAGGRRLVRASCATFAGGALLGGALTFGLLSVLGNVLGAGAEAGGGGAGAAAGAAAGAGGAGADGGSTVALVVAAALALAAALADLLGVRVAPQIRRQVPEGWRRTLPLPLAAALYGVLLGLGFTTFVLAFAVWALAGISVALGAPATGVAIGLAFGAGRALPVIAMAPRYETLGIRLAERMAAEPRLLRALRRTDAALLAAAAVALLLGPAAASADAAGARARPVAAGARADAAPARATPVAAGAARARPVTIATGATDPSASGGAVAWRVLGGARSTLRVPEAQAVTFDAPQLAIGGGNLARVAGAAIEVSALPGRALVATIPAAGVTALAVSATRVVWRTPRPGGGDELHAAALAPAAAPAAGAPAAAAGAPTRIAASAHRGAISRPSLDRDRLAYAVSNARGSRIDLRDLATGALRTRLRSQRTQLDQPALAGGRLLYVERRACDQRLRLTTLDATRRRSTRTLLTLGSTARRDAGHEHHHTGQGSEPSACPHGTPGRTRTVIWSTALDPRAAFVTLLRPAAGRAAPAARIVRIAR